MREISELVGKIKDYKNAIIQKTFISMKNTVAYVTINNKPRVLKWYIPGLKSHLEKEYDLLKRSQKHLQVPTVLKKDKINNVLILNFIIGENVCDILNDENTNTSEKERLVTLLADWYINFHNHFKKEKEFIIHGDANLRNFIFNDKIWGVDFEESRVGKPVEDIAEMCSSILTTDPMFTKEKFDISKVFIDSYLKKAPGRIIDINDEIAYSILKKIQWRPTQEDFLIKHSKKIKEKGIF
jgi:thiamine kinase-like enzyme